MHRVNIARNMLLVDIKISTWLGMRTDKDLTYDIKRSKNITDRRDRYVKNLLPDFAVKPVASSVQNIRSALKEYGIPFYGTGIYMIPAAELFEFRETVSGKINRFYKAIDANIEKWDDIIENSKHLRGDSFNPSDYPTPEEYRKLNKVSVAFMPVPESTHLDVDLPEEVLNEIKEEYEKKMDDLRISVVQNLINDIEEELSLTRSKILHAKKFGPSSVAQLAKYGKRAFRNNLTLNERLRRYGEHIQKIVPLVKPKRQSTEGELLYLIKLINEALEQEGNDEYYLSEIRKD